VYLLYYAFVIVQIPNHHNIEVVLCGKQCIQQQAYEQRTCVVTYMLCKGRLDLFNMHTKEFEGNIIQVWKMERYHSKLDSSSTIALMLH